MAFLVLFLMGLMGLLSVMGSFAFVFAAAVFVLAVVVVAVELSAAQPAVAVLCVIAVLVVSIVDKVSIAVDGDDNVSGSGDEEEQEDVAVVVSTGGEADTDPEQDKSLLAIALTLGKVVVLVFLQALVQQVQPQVLGHAVVDGETVTALPCSFPSLVLVGASVQVIRVASLELVFFTLLSCNIQVLVRVLFDDDMVIIWGSGLDLASIIVRLQLIFTICKQL